MKNKWIHFSIDRESLIGMLSGVGIVILSVIMTILRRWTKGYTIKQPNMDCQPTEITALMRHRAVFS